MVGFGVEAPLIPDNILSIGLRSWQETNSSEWQKPGMCYKEVVSHTPSANPPLPSFLVAPHPLPSEGCFCWVTDAKVPLIGKNETLKKSDLTERQARREGWWRWRAGGVWINCLENTWKGRINQSFFSISVLTFSVFLHSHPSSSSVFLYSTLLVWVSACVFTIRNS